MTTPSVTPSAGAMVVQQEWRGEIGGSSSSSSTGNSSPHGSFADMITFMREEREHMEQKMKEQQVEMETRLDQQRQETERVRQEMEKRLQEAKPQPASEAITEGQLEALQARLQSLHEAKLLSEDDLGRLEDTIADCIEVLPTADAHERSVERTVRMSQLSEKMAVDASLARQLRRKFV
jgi:hypothetical protein